MPIVLVGKVENRMDSWMKLIWVEKRVNKEDKLIFLRRVNSLLAESKEKTQKNILRKK